MKRRSMIIVALLCVLWVTPVSARNKDTVVLPTDVTQAREGCALVGIEGSYASDVTEAVNRVNEIRLEACQNGYPNPQDSTKVLTMADYVPVQWSSDLEYIARIRAAEATILTEHARPNGVSWGDLTSPGGIGSFSEVLAWQSWTGTLVDAIDNWYGEKNTWVSGGNGVTGHYTSMINPSVRYIGVATFNSNYGAWRSSSAGKFSAQEGLDTTAGAALDNCIQTIEVQQSKLSAPYIQEAITDDEDMDWYFDDMDNVSTETATIRVGDQKKYELLMDVNYDSDKAKVAVIDPITWTTSNPEVATVDAYGAVQFCGAGTVTITAASSAGTVASVTCSVSENVKKTKIKSITSGKKQFKIKWKKVKGNGYQIQYSPDPDFRKKTKIKKITKANTTSITIKRLKSKKYYYVRVRSIKKVKGTKYYSDWSNMWVVRTR